MKTIPPFITIIWDGFGIGPDGPGNAVSLAKKPVFDELKNQYPFTLLEASGKEVGLETGEISGSEVGHINIGAGRLIKQEARVISESIKDQSFFTNPAFLEVIKHVKKNKSKLHLMGLMSGKGSSHSRLEHFEALLTLAKIHKLKKVFFHFFSDGRDSYPKSALILINKWLIKAKELEIGKEASLSGRFYAMDRTKNWERLKKTFFALVKGEGEKAISFQEAIQKSYQKGKTDEFILPTIIKQEEKFKGKIEDGDGVIFFNLRSDRARQLTKLLVLPNSSEVELPKPRLKNLFFVTLTGFGPEINVKTAFNNSQIKHTLPFCLKDLRQLYLSETEKFAHVTYFLNGKIAHQIGGEKRLCLPSPRVNSYAETPLMAAPEITNTILDNLKEKYFNFIFVNFPNPDMLGHTGNMQATIKGIEYLDRCLGRIWKEVKKQKGGIFLLSDHGNADEMLDENGNIITSHTKNPVPFLIIYDKLKNKKIPQGGILSQSAPTILKIIGKNPYEQMIKGLI